MKMGRVQRKVQETQILSERTERLPKLGLWVVSQTVRTLLLLSVSESFLQHLG